MPQTRMYATIALMLFATGCSPAVLRIPGPTHGLGRTMPASRSLPPSVVVPPAPGSDPQERSSTPQASESTRTRESGRGKATDDEAVVRAALSILEAPPATAWRKDCSGYVCLVLEQAGRQASGGTESLWEDAQRQSRIRRPGIVRRGDLAFFDNTWDRNHNRRNDDPLTHVAVVIDIDTQGTLTLGHYGSSRGLTTFFLTPSQPHDLIDASGRRLNDYLRAKGRRDPSGTSYLASELLRGFAAPPRE